MIASPICALPGCARRCKSAKSIYCSIEHGNMGRRMRRGWDVTASGVYRRRAMTVQAERILQQEIMLRFKSWPIIALPIPNGIFIGGRSAAERTMAARVISKMKAQGMLVPGAPDLCLFWRGGAGLVELKRPASVDLMGVRHAAGRPSEAQRMLAHLAAELGVRHCYATSWDELKAQLAEWGLER